jgi:hypothetical protein
MKSLKDIRDSVSQYNHSEAYAQYLFRTNQQPGNNSWFEFMCAHNAKEKIAMPLRIIQGGVK